ncbi:hypothetical protein FE374_10790 [Georgenia yuyongxinii]|uniref:Uncharacterized protein n=1 Tax=Georgenia yuyongxinii TaxID=2589797 RepID=A0A5B8CAC1_9MICO|nr:hypothetical protein [Georgenia yuyongxinii]QDC25026.1 hypothetical protein FE374_10790 [Georgenia yuyongxinii]
MTWSQGRFRRGWFALPALARRGWLLLGLGVVTTMVVGVAGLGTPFVSGALAVLMCFALVLGLVTLMEAPGTPGGRGTPGRRLATGAFGRVPASWEYYETFGR